MVYISWRIAALMIGYAFGNICFGFIAGTIMDVDIRKEGSGNIGTTNTLRTLGKKVGAITLICDAGKAALAMFVVWLVFRNFCEPAQWHLLQMYAGLGAIIGHDFPITLGFKGGKGVAATLGCMLVLFPKFLPIALIIFITVVAITKYVSLGSILGGTSLLIQAWVAYFMGWLPFEGTANIECVVILTLIPLLMIVLHRPNIKRLLAGNENKLSFKSKRE